MLIQCALHVHVLLPKICFLRAMTVFQATTILHTRDALATQLAWLQHMFNLQ